TDVGDVDADAVLDAVDVEEVAAVLGNQRIDDEHARAERDELVREVAADEAKPSGDQHRPIAVELAIGAHGLVDSGEDAPRMVGLRKRTGELVRPRPSTTSFTHNRSTSIPVQKTRLKLKNCERPCSR